MRLPREYASLFSLPLLLLFAACTKSGGRLEPALDVRDHEIEVEVAPVERANIAARLELTGTLIPRDRSFIVSEVDAVVLAFPKSPSSVNATPKQRELLRSIGYDLDTASLSLNLGDVVKKGDVLVQLDPRDFELELAAARAKQAKARADLEHLLAWKRPEELRRLKALETEARARLEQARTDLERARSLREKDVLTVAELDRRRTEVTTREAALESATASLQIATSGPTQSEVAVARALVALADVDVEAAEERLSKTVIHAPYDCVITERFLGVGDQASTQQRVEIMEIMDVSLLLAQVSVPERFIGNVRLGDRVTVHAEGTTSAAGGLVVLINDKVDRDTRTFRTRVMVENPDRRFKVGQFARVTFDVATAPDAPATPSAALVYRGGSPHVFVFGGGKVELRSVVTGITDNRSVEIVSGLSEGESVVVDDPAILADGMKVRLRRALPGGSETRASKSNG